ncbi:MAG: hypothetical protein NZM04_01755 [Methylacidiphilales bacterium]|nr:hypothetical protein [Candidatus Methylacidiphilales bacterium]
MSEVTISREEFQREVEQAAGSIFRSHGFQRAPEFESVTPTTASVVYLGKNIAFTFTFDLRDQAIDLLVTRYRNGKLLAIWDGGYSSSLFTYLLKHCGYRGRPTPPSTLPQTATKLQRMIATSLSLLEHPAAARLLTDNPDVLPA